ncbi:hypothetical protein [Serratia liquefaciens]|uniref:hypothetical protein n=1 Tax=Serratia liquefaciens TaxID=614 RepID=UPI003906A812
MNINTLKSYFRKDGNIPVPRDNLLARIAASEGTSLEWLKYGEGESPVEQQNQPISPESPKQPSGGDALSQILVFLTTDERRQLATMLARKGIETILYLLDEDNIKLLRLDRVMKEKILGIQPRTPEEVARADDEARVCDADNSRETHPGSVASTKRHAS